MCCGLKILRHFDLYLYCTKENKTKFKPQHEKMTDHFIFYFRRKKIIIDILLVSWSSMLKNLFFLFHDSVFRLLYSFQMNSDLWTVYFTFQSCLIRISVFNSPQVVKANNKLNYKYIAEHVNKLTCQIQRQSTNCHWDHPKQHVHHGFLQVQDLSKASIKQ